MCWPSRKVYKSSSKSSRCAVVEARVFSTSKPGAVLFCLSSIEIISNKTESVANILPQYFTMKLSFLAFLSVVGLTLASPVPETAAGKGNLQKRETALNAFLTVLLEYLPAIDATISSLVDVLTDFEDLLVLITGDQDTYNELGGPCTEYTVIFARGTTEPGNVGILVGPPFFDALTSAAGTSSIFTFQGVNDYSASVDGYLEGGDPKGSAEM
jgi:cutinase